MQERLRTAKPKGQLQSVRAVPRPQQEEEKDGRQTSDCRDPVEGGGSLHESGLRIAKPKGQLQAVRAVPRLQQEEEKDGRQTSDCRDLRENN